MKLFFEPETVALIGASSQPGRPGHHLFLNLNQSFGEKFYPINPRVDSIGDKKCYSNPIEVPVDIDLAVVFIPAQGVPEALEQCAQKGIQRVIIESGGFSEAGKEGQIINKRCLDIARQSNMRLWGPNCMGLINVNKMNVLSFMIHQLWQGKFLEGPVSLIVQSGMLSAGFLMHILSRRPFGLSKICSIGNKMDVNENDILEYLIDDPQTGVIAMYLESIEQGRRFFELCRSATKPLIVLKSGRTPSGAAAAMSHTASLAQNDQVINAALRQAGVIRVDGLNELMHVARSMGSSLTSSKKTSKIAVLAFSGGAGVLATDSIGDYGMALTQFNDLTINRLKEVFPVWMDPLNPVDLYPAMEKNGRRKALLHALEAVMADPDVDAVYTHLIVLPTKEPLIDYDKVATILKK
ncbi:MAG: CoA-binding protein, partial [Desulfobacterales bacterium]|nr:CoA-binding protein [Desulfobacterales bacterium]